MFVTKVIVTVMTLLVASRAALALNGTYRLPLEAVPVAYDVALVPYLNDGGNRSFTFDGNAVITVRAQQAVSTITLHAKDMDIEEIDVTDLKLTGYGLETTRDFLTINLNEALVPGELYNVTIRYQGNLRNNLAGFYRSSYKTAAGETRWLATTQFQATDARRAFPSFDEPALKATFVIRIAPPVGLHAVSNMPVASITGPDLNNANRYWYIFERSVVMSSYLVAFVVSDFAIAEHGPFRILGRSDSIDTSHYALAISPALLEVMVNLTGVEYSLSKMDQVAVPDMLADGMENWGLVTYREKYLLLTWDIQSTRRTAAPIIAHEFAHQWFGNLVSPDWWTYSWLNEAFASFFEYFVTNKVEPNWKLLTSMVTVMQHDALRTDALKPTYPITRYVETPSEIFSLFDTIIYWKGGSLIKMIYHFLTEPTFFKGLNIYLNIKAYGAAVPDELFQAWQEAATEDGVLPSDLTIKAILDTWTLQAGYPVLTVTRDYAAGTASITQKRFVMTGTTNDELWYVPISYTTRSERNFDVTAPSLWLTPDQESITIKGIAADDWLVLNIQAAAFYRVNYDTKNWGLLTAALAKPNYDGIHTLNRAQILDDGRQLGVSRSLSPETYLNTLHALRNERVPAVWRTMLREITHLHDRLANTEHFSSLKGAFAYIVEGWVRNRKNVPGGVEEDEVLDWAYALTDIFVKLDVIRSIEESGSQSSPAQWCAAVRVSSVAYNTAWRRYEAASSLNERRDVLAALGCAPDAQRLLTAVVGDNADLERVRPEDRTAALAAPCGSESRTAVGGGGARACEQAIEFLARNAGRRQIFEDVDDILSTLRRLASRVRTEGQYEMLKMASSWISKERPLPAGPDALYGLLESARAQVDWSTNEGAPIVSWLRRHKTDSRVRHSEEM